VAHFVSKKAKSTSAACTGVSPAHRNIATMIVLTANFIKLLSNILVDANKAQGQNHWAHAAFTSWFFLNCPVRVKPKPMTS